MVSDSTTSVGSAPQAAEIMASIDTEGQATRLIIADITTDGTWLSIPAAAAASLTEWR